MDCQQINARTPDEACSWVVNRWCEASDKQLNTDERVQLYAATKELGTYLASTPSLQDWVIDEFSLLDETQTQNFAKWIAQETLYMKDPDGMLVDGAFASIYPFFSTIITTKGLGRSVFLQEILSRSLGIMKFAPKPSLIQNTDLLEKILHYTNPNK